MGNYTSCTYKAIRISSYMNTKSSKSAKVIFPDGEIQQYREPINVAELMLDFPNLFLVNFRSIIKAGQRFQPLRADQYLEPANIYVFFPMKRLHSVVTTADVANISFMLSSSSSKIATVNTNMFKVTPEIEESGGPRLSLDGVEGFPMQEFKNRSGIFMCRSKKPMLDTIRE